MCGRALLSSPPFRPHPQGCCWPPPPDQAPPSGGFTMLNAYNCQDGVSLTAGAGGASSTAYVAQECTNWLLADSPANLAFPRVAGSVGELLPLSRSPSPSPATLRLLNRSHRLPDGRTATHQRRELACAATRRRPRRGGAQALLHGRRPLPGRRRSDRARLGGLRRRLALPVQLRGPRNRRHGCSCGSYSSARGRSAGIRARCAAAAAATTAAMFRCPSRPLRVQAPASLWPWPPQ